MTVIERGRIKGKSIVFAKRLGFPDGTEVSVRVEAVETADREGEARGVFSDLPFFGMWADRPEMEDGPRWVHEERATWQTRSMSQD